MAQKSAHHAHLRRRLFYDVADGEAFAAISGTFVHIVFAEIEGIGFIGGKIEGFRFVLTLSMRHPSGLSHASVSMR